jgi:hypothetical protein
MYSGKIAVPPGEGGIRKSKYQENKHKIYLQLTIRFQKLKTFFANIDSS